MNKVSINGTIVSNELVKELYHCISVRLGFIETGSWMRASDVIRTGQHSKIRALSTEQKQLVLDLEHLMQELIQ